MRQKRNYNNLYRFLQDKGCPLPNILRSRTVSNAPINYQDLSVEATKWAKTTLMKGSIFLIFTWRQIILKVKSGHTLDIIFIMHNIILGMAT